MSTSVHKDSLHDAGTYVLRGLSATAIHSNACVKRSEGVRTTQTRDNNKRNALGNLHYRAN